MPPDGVRSIALPEEGAFGISGPGISASDIPASGKTSHDARIKNRETTAMPRDALRSILPAVGWPAARADAVAFSGGTDPILPTPFRIGEAGAATLAATGLAAADLWELRSGRRQDIAVDTRRSEERRVGKECA